MINKKPKKCLSRTCRQEFTPVKRGLTLSKHCCAACELDDSEAKGNAKVKVKAIKQKKCSICKELFTPFNSISTCSPKCERERLRKVAEKEYDKITKEMKKELNDKDSSFWSDKAQKMCNKYILIRDAKKPCISCGNTNNVKYDAGHYLSRGHSAALRFNEFNIHKQCSNYCNVANSGQSVRYRQALVKLYGEERVLWLEGPHELPRYRIEDYKHIYEVFKLKIKALKNV